MQVYLFRFFSKNLIVSALFLFGSGAFAQTTLFQFGFESVTTPTVDNVVGTPTMTSSGVTLVYSSDEPCELSEELRGNAWATADYYRIAVNTTGYKDLVLSYCNHTNTTNLGAFRVRVSPGNTAYTTVVPDYVPGNSSAVVTSNQFPASANNTSIVWIEFYKVNNSGNNNNRFFLDNVVLTGSPVLPQVSSFSPAVACPQASVTISGTGFTGVTGVSVNNTPVASFTVNSSSSISATLAAGTSSGTVKVTNADGTGTSAGILSVNTVAPSASATVATICSGSSTQLNASAVALAGSVNGSAAPGLAIPDNNTTGISSTITLPATCALAGNIASVNVNITHTWNGDLRAYLISPSGTQLALFTDKGGSGNNINATFQTGAAALPATGDYSISGTYAPQTAFSGFTGAGAGNWTLKVVDNANQDNGTLNSWSIALDNAGCGTVTYIWSPATGLSSTTVANPVASPVATQTYTVMATNGTGCSGTASVQVTVNPVSAAIGGTITTSSTVCFGNNSGTLTLSGYTGAISGWESSLDNFATAGIPIANTTASQPYSNLTATTYYRAIVTNGACATVYSSTASLTVDPSTAWTGTNGTSWHDAGNWVCGVVPTNALNVTIPVTANQPVISADAQANTLTLQTGATLTLESGNSLLVVGAINVQGTANFTVQNNANLVQVDDVENTGNITVKRNSSALMRQDYTLWSSPVAGQNLQAFSPQTLANRFYTYNSGTNQYNTVASPGVTAFNEAQSYLIRMPNNHPATPTVWTGQFTGVPNNGDIAFALSNGGAGLRFNAIGNPYPSAIDIETFVHDNSDNITGAIYFWRKTNNAASPSYCSWTPGAGFVGNGEAQASDPNGIIRTGQGFIVEASASGSSVTFNNAQRLGDNANQFFRSATQVERNRIWLNASNAAGAFSQTLVGYITGATLGMDSHIDARFFNDGEVSLYSLATDERMVIQGRPLPFADTDVVPLGFKAGAAGTYTIAIDHVDGLFLGEQDIFVRDNLANTVQDLKAGAYEFVSEAGTFNSRFELIYQNALGVGDPELGPQGVIVYKDRSEFVVNSAAGDMESIKVFDMNGRLLAEVRDINAAEARLAVPEANQVLLFKIRTVEGQELNKKVVN